MQPGESVAQTSPLNHQTNGSYQNGHQPLDVSQNSADLDQRGRARKKRDFFGTLKRRLGRSKSRAKSSERGTIPGDAENPNGELRSISADRISTLGNNSGGGLTSNTSAGNYSMHNSFICFCIFNFIGFFLRFYRPCSAWN